MQLQITNSSSQAAIMTQMSSFNVNRKGRLKPSGAVTDACDNIIKSNLPGIFYLHLHLNKVAAQSHLSIYG